MLFQPYEGVDGYRNEKRDYEWFDNQTEETFTNVNGTTWEHVSNDREYWDRQMQYINSTRLFLKELGFDPVQVKRDVQFNDDEFFGQAYASLAHSERYTANWKNGELDSFNGTNDASTSAVRDLQSRTFIIGFSIHSYYFI